jgi:hypothetical protein
MIEAQIGYPVSGLYAFRQQPGGQPLRTLAELRVGEAALTLDDAYFSPIQIDAPV